MKEEADTLSYLPEEELAPELYAGLAVETPPLIPHEAASSDQGLETKSIEAETAIAEEEGSQPGWLRRNLLKISFATFLGSVALTVGTNPLAGTEKEILDAAPWMIAGLAASEISYIGGGSLMAASAGVKIRNPFNVRSRWDEIGQEVVASRGFKAGLALNTIGAVGTATTVVVGAVTTLPTEAWPAALGFAAADLAGTAAGRAPMYASIKQAETIANIETSQKVTVRKAQESDIDRLADIDILLFDKAYGSEVPNKQEVVEMLKQRLHNNPGWMFVSEVDGEVEGFVSAFRTNKPIEEFTSWEDCTNNGTLQDRVDPKGKYVYVTNMTVKHEAVELGAKEMLLANLFANSIRDGIEYGYFAARMPHFKRWLEAQNIDTTPDNARQYAEHYLELRGEDGKRQDPQLKMYEELGYKLQRMVPDAFEDDASMNFGVLFRADIPPGHKALKKIKPLRSAMAGSLRQLAKKPKLLAKVF